MAIGRTFERSFMKLEKQVCSLGLAKQLRKFRVSQDSLWYWCREGRKWSIEWGESNKPVNSDEYISAFTVAELGKMLPIQIDAGMNGRGISSELLNTHKGTFGGLIQWQVMYYDVKFINDYTEADARAKMLIYLLENDLMDKSSVQPNPAR
jgi:hypothetical protein